MSSALLTRASTREKGTYFVEVLLDERPFTLDLSVEDWADPEPDQLDLDHLVYSWRSPADYIVAVASFDYEHAGVSDGNLFVERFVAEELEAAEDSVYAWDPKNHYDVLKRLHGEEILPSDRVWRWYEPNLLERAALDVLPLPPWATIKHRSGQRPRIALSGRRSLRDLFRYLEEREQAALAEQRVRDAVAGDVPRIKQAQVALAGLAKSLPKPLDGEAQRGLEQLERFANRLSKWKPAKRSKIKRMHELPYLLADLKEWKKQQMKEEAERQCEREAEEAERVASETWHKAHLLQSRGTTPIRAFLLCEKRVGDDQEDWDYRILCEGAFSDVLWDDLQMTPDGNHFELLFPQDRYRGMPPLLRLDRAPAVLGRKYFLRRPDGAVIGEYIVDNLESLTFEEMNKIVDGLLCEEAYAGSR